MYGYDKPRKKSLCKSFVYAAQFCQPCALSRSSKARCVTSSVYGTLHIEYPLTLFKKGRVVIPVAGFLVSSHRYMEVQPGWESLMGLLGRIGTKGQMLHHEAVYKEL